MTKVNTLMQKKALGPLALAVLPILKATAPTVALLGADPVGSKLGEMTAGTGKGKPGTEFGDDLSATETLRKHTSFLRADREGKEIEAKGGKSQIITLPNGEKAAIAIKEDSLADKIINPYTLGAAGVGGGIMLATYLANRKKKKMNKTAAEYTEDQAKAMAAKTDVEGPDSRRPGFDWTNMQNYGRDIKDYALQDVPNAFKAWHGAGYDWSKLDDQHKSTIKWSAIPLILGALGGGIGYRKNPLLGALLGGGLGLMGSAFLGGYNRYQARPLRPVAPVTPPTTPTT